MNFSGTSLYLGKKLYGFKAMNLLFCDTKDPSAQLNAY